MLMDLLRSYLRAEVARLVESGTRLSVIGRRDRLPEGLANEIAAAQDRAMGGRALHLRIAIDYSARDSIVQAASSLRAGVEPTRENMHRLITRRGERRERRRRSPDPLRRREKIVGFSAVGMRLCRALLHQSHVAGVRRR